MKRSDLGMEFTRAQVLAALKDKQKLSETDPELAYRFAVDVLLNCIEDGEITQAFNAIHLPVMSS